MSKSRQKAFFISSAQVAMSQLPTLVGRACRAAALDLLRWDAPGVFPAGQTINEALAQAISSSQFVIADLSDASPNVMYEVGLAQAFRKPVIFLSTSSRAIPFDFAGFRVLIYDLDAPDDFVTQLTRSLSDAKKRPGGMRRSAPAIFG